MLHMLVTVSPLTTSVNAVTWQDYIGMYVQTCLVLRAVHLIR